MVDLDKPRPVQHKVGQTVIPIYFRPGDGKRRKHGAYVFRIYEAGRPRLVERTTLAEAKKEADRRVRKIESGRVGIGDLTAADDLSYLHAVKQLEALGDDAPPLHVALAEYIDAKRLLPAGTSLTVVATIYAQTHAKHASLAPSEILDRFLVVLSDRSKNRRHLRGRRHDLLRFCAWLPKGKLLSEITADEIQTYLRHLLAGTMTDMWNGKRPKNGNWPAIGERRRDNIRNGINELFNFARENGYLADRTTEAEKVKQIKPVHEIRYYTPEQLVGWLLHVRKEWRPWFVLVAFAGLRSSEVVGDKDDPGRPTLQWEHFRWDKGFILVPKTVARKINRARRAPLRDNVIEWLLPWRNATGPIYPPGSDQELETDRLQKRLKRAWDNNALRHSYGTHRNAEISNAGQLAEEMGTSVAMVRKNYDAVPADIDPVAYFGVVPTFDEEGQIIPKIREKALDPTIPNRNGTDFRVV